MDSQLTTEWDFRPYLAFDIGELLYELAETHQNLAVIHEEIAYLRVQEKARAIDGSERVMREGTRDALIEKKFLLIRLIETPRLSQ